VSIRVFWRLGGAFVYYMAQKPGEKKYHKLVNNRCESLKTYNLFGRFCYCFVKSVCPSVLMEQLGSHLTDYHESLYLRVLYNICRENSSYIKI